MLYKDSCDQLFVGNQGYSDSSIDQCAPNHCLLWHAGLSVTVNNSTALLLPHLARG